MIPPKNPIGFLRILKVSCLRVANIRVAVCSRGQFNAFEEKCKQPKKIPRSTGTLGILRRKENDKAILAHAKLKAIVLASRSFSFDYYNPERGKIVPEKVIFWKKRRQAGPSLERGGAKGDGATG